MTCTACCSTVSLVCARSLTSDPRLEVSDDLHGLLQHGEFGLRALTSGVYRHHATQLFERFVDITHTDSDRRNRVRVRQRRVRRTVDDGGRETKHENNMRCDF